MARSSLRDILRRNFVTVAVALATILLLVGGVLLDRNNADSTDAVARQSQSLEGQSLQGHAQADMRKRLDKGGKRGDKTEGRRELKGFPGPHFGGPFGSRPGGDFGGPLSKALRDDLQNMRKADPSERAALQHKMFVKALAGDYGDMAKRRAEMLKEIVDGS